MALNPSLATWPEKFGCALADPEVGMHDPVERNDMDFGFKSRPRYVNPIPMGTYRVHMDNEQFKYFQSWHKYTINNGGDWFNFQIRSGDSLEWQEVKMTQMYESQAMANKFFVVTLSLIQRTDDIPSAGELATYLAS